MKRFLWIPFLLLLILLLTGSASSFILPDGSVVDSTFDNANKYISVGDTVQYAIVYLGKTYLEGTGNVTGYNKATGLVNIRGMTPEGGTREVGLYYSSIVKIITIAVKPLTQESTQLLVDNTALRLQVNMLIEENTKLKSQMTQQLNLINLLTETKNTLALLLSKLMKYN